MKYFTLGIICIVLVLFISSFKDAEMKSVDSVEIQDGKLHAITDPMTSLKEEQERQASVCGVDKTYKTFGKCYQEECGGKNGWCDCNWCGNYCGGCNVNCSSTKGSELNEWCQENCRKTVCPECNDMTDTHTWLCSFRCTCVEDEDDNGFEGFIAGVKETCATKFQIGKNTFNEGEDTCRERCRSDPDCNYYFYTFKETCDDKEWCVLYKDCSERRIPGCNGRTFRKTD